MGPAGSEARCRKDFRPFKPRKMYPPTMRTNGAGQAPFETERLIGREWNEADVPAAFAIYGDAEIMKGLGRGPEADLESQRENLLKAVAAYRERPYGTGYWALVQKSDGQIVGASIVKPIPGDEAKVEIGWHLAREFWGRGYATEGAREAIRIAFRHLPVDRLYALAFPWNVRSLAVMGRLGFRRGELTRAYYDAELVLHTLERADWQAAT